MRFAFRSVVSFQAFRLSTLTFLSYATLALGAFLATYSEPALAYVGPPAALGTIGAVLGLGMAVFGMVFFGIMSFFGLTLPSFLRVLRRLIIGNIRPALPVWKRRRLA